MSNELWPVGTWVAIKVSGYALCVTQSDKNMRLTPFTEKIGERIVGSKAPYVEIPPKPDEEVLRWQGYRLTGMAADCSKKGHGHLWVYGDEPIVYDGEVSTWDICEGWRWLVERIEEEEMPAAKPSSPWIDASERAPEDDETRESDRNVLLRLHSQKNSPIHIVGYFDAAGRVREHMDGRIVSHSQYPRIQWMDIPE